MVFRLQAVHLFKLTTECDTKVLKYFAWGADIIKGSYNDFFTLRHMDMDDWVSSYEGYGLEGTPIPPEHKDINVWVGTDFIW